MAMDETGRMGAAPARGAGLRRSPWFGGGSSAPSPDTDPIRALRRDRRLRAGRSGRRGRGPAGPRLESRFHRHHRGQQLPARGSSDHRCEHRAVLPHVHRPLPGPLRPGRRPQPLFPRPGQPRLGGRRRAALSRILRPARQRALLRRPLGSGAPVPPGQRSSRARRDHRGLPPGPLAGGTIEGLRCAVAPRGDASPPYSSGLHGSTPALQWPFAAWGVAAVLAGHDHVYERIERDGVLYFVNGLGGHPARYPFRAPVPGSRVRYWAQHGAMRVEANACRITFEFVTVDGRRIDAATRLHPACGGTSLRASGSLRLDGGRLPR